MLAKKHTLILLILALVSVFVLPELFGKGMFVDGVIYASISRNMSQGLGTWWTPYYSAHFYTHFVEHPPLFFWVQSFWFTLIGDRIFTERLFDLVLLLINTRLMFFIVRSETRSQNAAYVALVLYITTPIVYWAYGNNVIELLVTTFLLLGWILSEGLGQKSGLLNVVLVTVLTLLGFLSKGPIALAILAFPLTRIFSSRSNRAILFSLLFTSIGFVTIFFVLIQFDAPRLHLFQWFDNQVVGSLDGTRKSEYVTSRFAILRLFLSNAISPLAIGLLILIIRRSKIDWKGGLPLLLATLGLTVPLMVSQKQHEYYLVPAFGFFAMFLAVSLRSSVDDWVASANRKFMIKAINLSLIFIIAVCSFFSVKRKDGYVRNVQLLSDINAISAAASQKSLSVNSRVSENWGLRAYLMRYHFISLDRDQQFDFWVVDNNQLEGFQIISENTKEYHLAIRK